MAWGGRVDILLSSPAHTGSSGRLPAPGAPIPGLRPSKLFPGSSYGSNPPPELPFPRDPLPPQLLAKAQAGAFDPGLWGWEGVSCDRPMMTACFTWAGCSGLPASQLVRPSPVPASLAASGRRGSAATSPHEAQPMGGSYFGQPNTTAAPGYSQSHSVPQRLLSCL